MYITIDSAVHTSRSENVLSCVRCHLYKDELGKKLKWVCQGPTVKCLPLLFLLLLPWLLLTLFFAVVVYSFVVFVLVLLVTIMNLQTFIIMFNHQYLTNSPNLNITRFVVIKYQGAQ